MRAFNIMQNFIFYTLVALLYFMFIELILKL